MRIVTYNIRLALDSSLERIARVLLELEPDVVCLQEVGRHWSMGEKGDMRGVLARLTGLRHAVFGPAIQEDDAQYGIAVLSRHAMTVLERRPLPQVGDEPRVFLGCRVENPDDPFVLVTSHLSVVPGDRPGQFDALTRWSLTLGAREALPLVIAGDLNAELDEKALREAMAWMKVRSAHRVANGTAPKSYPTTAPELAIDHVLVSRQWRVEAAGAAEVEGSDHLPVWADVALEREGG